uniref:Uncharacterized protein n=1 Tax=Rhizophora mucronata TaxID=61149 RepID=A0A2P2IVK9_RHIMU
MLDYTMKCLMEKSMIEINFFNQTIHEFFDGPVHNRTKQAK